MGTVNLGYVVFAILCFCVGGGLGFVVGRMYQWWTHDELPKVTIPEGYTLRRMPRKKGEIYGWGVTDSDTNKSTQKASV